MKEEDDMSRKGEDILVKRYVPFLLVLPAFIVLFSVTIFPTIWSLYMSFHQYNPIIGKPVPVGWKNFSYILHWDRFQNSVVHLFYYLLFGVGIEMILGITVALLLYELIKSEKIRLLLLVLFIIPMMIPPSIVGTLWRFLLDPFSGVVNTILSMLHLPVVDWFGSKMALASLIIADIWEWTSLPLMIIYSGRVSLPQSVYEAAWVDGASQWTILRRITLPMLKELIAIALIIRFMDAYKFIDKVTVMTQGGPGGASELPSYLAYLVGAQQFNMGVASAMTWIIGLGSIIVIMLFVKFMKKVLKSQKIA